MITVATVSKSGVPSVRTYPNEQAMIADLQKEADKEGKVIWEVSTARDMAKEWSPSLSPLVPRSKFASCGADGFWVLADEWGWDTPLYRADYLCGWGCYRGRPIDPIDAATAFLKKTYAFAEVFTDPYEIDSLMDYIVQEFPDLGKLLAKAA